MNSVTVTMCGHHNLLFTFSLSYADALPPKKKAKKATGECANYNKECVIVLIGGMCVVV